MPQGDLLVQITDMAGDPMRERIEIDLQPVSGPAGAGGERMSLDVKMGTAIHLTITGILCRGGVGTQYRVLVTSDHHRPYSFFQNIRDARVNTASDDVAFWVKPGDVKNIRAPKFDDLNIHGGRLLDTAVMTTVRPEDNDLAGLRGKALYQRLGPLRQACFLNLLKKAGHPATAANCLPMLQSLALCRQDRFFVLVDDALPEHLRQSPLYKSAPNQLHEPLKGYQLTEGSFKTRDAHANLQVTFMRNGITGQLAADVDIDEAAGIEHGFEVIGNAIFNKRTNPYLIREFMLAADPLEHTLDPGYRFLFS
jgi:hypothetical protein